MADHKTWTSENFLYDKLLTARSLTSGRRGSSPIDVYDSYRQRGVDIDTLCNLGADIITIVEASGLEGIEPHFLKWCVWWRLKNQNLFGIHITSTKPRLMFEGLWWEYLTEAYPEYKFTTYRQFQAEVCKEGITVQELEGAFIDKLRDVAPEQDVDLDDHLENLTINWAKR